MIDYEKMMTHVKSHPFPLVFATVSGAHLNGFRFRFARCAFASA